MCAWFVNYAGTVDAAKKKAESGKKTVARNVKSKKRVRKEKERLYILRDIISELYKDHLEEETNILCYDAPKWSPPWLGAFSKAVAKVHGMLTKNQMWEAEDTLERWNKIGAPDHVKAK